MRVVIVGFAMLLAATGIWSAGYLWFLGSIPAEAAQRPADEGDCVAVFTGRNERVQAGAELLIAGGPTRMFVSGARYGTDPGYIDRLRAELPGVFDCCIEVSEEARNTEQNGIETAAWALQAGCRRIWLVTDDLHLRRAEVELAARLDDIAILPWPLPRYAPPGQDRAIMSGVTAMEFNKFIVAGMRHLLFSGR